MFGNVLKSVLKNLHVRRKFWESMSVCVFKLYSQYGTKDFLALSLSSIGSVECNYSTVFKFLSLSVAKSDVLGDISIWNPNCCGFVTITTAGNINNYTIRYATTVGVGNRLEIHMLLA